MDIYYNNKKVSTLDIRPESTIGGLKSSLKNWLEPQGITDYITKLQFSNKSELSPLVFTTDQYDNMNFQNKKDLLKGGKIFIITPVKQKISKEKHIYVLYNIFRGKNFDYASDILIDVLQWYMDHYILDQYPDSPEDIMKDYNLPYPIDYNNPNHRQRIIDNINDGDINILEGTIKC